MAADKSTKSEPEKRPMAKARQVGLFRRKIIESLSPTGIDLMLASASCISEGQLCGDGRYYGSSMITLDLQHLMPRVTDACDASTAKRLASYLTSDREALKRFADRGRSEALGIAAEPLIELDVDVKVRADGAMVYVDIDVEGQSSVERIRGARRAAVGAKKAQ